MLRRRRPAGVLLVAATLLGAAAVWTVRGGEAAAQEAGPPPDTVTLVTGDRVTLSGGNVTVRRGAGRERVNFLIHRDRGGIAVVPTDAVAALAAGRLDPRLFEVKGLPRAGGEAGPPVVPEESTGAPTYELTIRYLDRAGRPAANYLSYVVGLDVDARESPFDPGGTVTVRLPRGSYQLGTFIPNGVDDPNAGTMLVQPVLRLTGPRTVVMDARLGRPVSVSVPERDAVPVHTVIGYSATVDGAAVGGDLYAESPAGMYTAQIGGDEPVEGFASLVATGWRSGVSGDSPYGYHLAYYASEDLGENTVQWFDGAPRAYRPGRVYDESWNKAVFAPAFPPRPGPALWMTRTGDRMLVWPSWYGDAEGRDGYSDPRTSAITLYRDDKLLGGAKDAPFGEFDVPAEPGRYRLEIAATRGEPHTLSTEIATTWKFDSAHADGDAPMPLPLSAIRFAPALDDENAAPAGRAFAVPVVVSAQPGSAAGEVAELAVDVSYDDGVTWERAEVRRHPGGGTAVLRHPAGPGYVSLRATAADALGNTVTQTVVHAYRLRAASS